MNKATKIPNQKSRWSIERLSKRFNFLSSRNSHTVTTERKVIIGDDKYLIAIPSTLHAFVNEALKKYGRG